MAEAVQQQLERMLEELSELERRGIFTHAEIRWVHHGPNCCACALTTSSR